MSAAPVAKYWSGDPLSAVVPSAESAGGWSGGLTKSRGGPPELTRIAVAAEVVVQAASLAAWKTYAPPWGKAWPGAVERTVMPSADTAIVPPNMSSSESPASVKIAVGVEVVAQAASPEAWKTSIAPVYSPVPARIAPGAPRTATVPSPESATEFPSPSPEPPPAFVRIAVGVELSVQPSSAETLYTKAPPPFGFDWSLSSAVVPSPLSATLQPTLPSSGLSPALVRVAVGTEVDAHASSLEAWKT